MQQDRRKFISTLSGSAILAAAGLLHAQEPDRFEIEVPINVIIPKAYKPPVEREATLYQRRLVRATLEVLETHYSETPVPVWDKPFGQIDFEKRLNNIAYWLMVAIKKHMNIYPVEPAWIFAQIMKESFFYEFAVSSALAVGICQFIRPTGQSYGLLCGGTEPEHHKAPYKKPELAKSADQYYQTRSVARRYRRNNKPAKRFSLEEALRTIAYGSGKADRVAAQKQLDYLEKLQEYDLIRKEARDNYRTYLRENVSGRNIFNPQDLEFIVKFDERFTYKKPVMAMVQMMAEGLRSRNGNILAATIGYNAGISSTAGGGRYKRYGRIPAIDQSVDYLSHILINHYDIMQRLA